MATVQTIINRSLRQLGQIATGQSPTASESNEAFIAINAMLGSWFNEKLMVYAIVDISIPIISGNTTRTIGASGNVVSTRPPKLESAYVIYSTTSIPVEIINDDQWSAIPEKTATSSYPTKIYYEPDYPNGTIYLYPVPNGSSTLHVMTWTPLTAFVALTDVISLPPGYEDALAFNLSVMIAPEYEIGKAPDVIVEMARTTKANIKRVNARPVKAYTELSALIGSDRGNIITGQP